MKALKNILIATTGALALASCGPGKEPAREDYNYSAIDLPHERGQVVDTNGDGIADAIRDKKYLRIKFYNPTTSKKELEVHGGTLIEGKSQPFTLELQNAATAYLQAGREVSFQIDKANQDTPRSPEDKQ